MRNARIFALNVLPAAVAILAVTAAPWLAPAAQAQKLIDEMVAPPAQQGGQAAETDRQEVPIDELQPAWAGKEPVRGPGQVSAGVKPWKFDPNKVEIIDLRRNDFTYIYFPEWEHIEDITVGDSQNFSVKFPSDASGRVVRYNVLLAQPKGNVVQADTTLHVTGSLHDGRRNIYSAKLISSPLKSPDAGDVTVFVEAPEPDDVKAMAAGERSSPGADKPPAETALGGIGPRDTRRPDANAESPRNDYLRTIPFDYASMRFGTYQVKARDSDSETIAPVRVMEDGYWTYIDFGENGRSDRILRPTVWRVVDGVDTLVNTRTVGPKGNILIVEGTGYNMTLRNGERVVCLIYSGKALLPGAGRPE